MKRKILEDLLAWKTKKNRKPLIFTGVRQCGKTYILKYFGREYFDDFAYFSLDQLPQIGEVFEKDFDTNRIINDLSNYFLKREIIPGKTLLVLDEIQNQPKAVSSFKYFAEDMPELAIIGAGSLLGVSLREDDASFPVGKIDRLKLFPMNFEEFLWATSSVNYNKPISSEKLINEPLPKYIFEDLIRFYEEYLIVGGMPEAVANWKETRNIQIVNEIQDNIMFGYENDFSKHAPKNELTNLHAIWNSIPQQLAKDNNKFVFSQVKKSARAKTFEKSLGWLIDAGLIHVLTKVENAQSPLSANQDSSFYKVYFCDVGLLSRKSNFTLTNLQHKNEDTGGFRGSITENYVLNELLAQNYKPFFWRSGNTAELDFLIEHDGNIIPIEAKANINTKAKSYLQFVKQYKNILGFKISLKNTGLNTVDQTTTINLPLPLTFNIKNILDAYLKKQ